MEETKDQVACLCWWQVELRSESSVQLQLDEVLQLTSFSGSFWARAFHRFFHQKFSILAEIWEVCTEIKTIFLGVCEDLAGTWGQAAHRNCGISSTFVGIQNLSRNGTKQPSVTLNLALLWAGGWTRWPPNFTSDVLWFCNSAFPFSSVISRTKSAKFLLSLSSDIAVTQHW